MKALIFDLDNCLAPATQVGEALFTPVFDAISANNHSHLSSETLARAFADMWRHPYDWVAETYAFTSAMKTAGWQQLQEAQVQQPMHGYGDLDVLNTLPGEKFLVTAGFSKLQHSKIQALNLASYFRELLVDAIDLPERLGKQGLFEDIMQRYHLAKKDVLIIGDNKDSEIAAGRRLGLVTVQTLRPGVPKTQDANFHVHNLQELRELIQQGHLTN